MLEDDQTLRSQADEVEKKYGSKSKELEELWARQTLKGQEELEQIGRNDQGERLARLFLGRR